MGLLGLSVVEPWGEGPAQGGKQGLGCHEKWKGANVSIPTTLQVFTINDVELYQIMGFFDSIEIIIYFPGIGILNPSFILKINVTGSWFIIFLYIIDLLIF